MSKEWKWNGKYPVRCKIVDVEGKDVGFGFMGRTPEESKPHIGKEGTAVLENKFFVKITLDDGAVIFGSQCWWDALPPKEDA